MDDCSLASPSDAAHLVITPFDSGIFIIKSNNKNYFNSSFQIFFDVRDVEIILPVDKVVDVVELLQVEEGVDARAVAVAVVQHLREVEADADVERFTDCLVEVLVELRAQL